MSVWGKVSGAAAGLFVGGPVGALVGAVAGHFFLDRESDPGVTFTLAVGALSGEMARAARGGSKKDSLSSPRPSGGRRKKKATSIGFFTWRARILPASNISPARSPGCS